MTTHHHRGRRTVATLAAGVVLLGAAGGTAWAAGTATVDPARTASLSIHKFEEPEADTGLPNNGTQLPGAALGGLTPLGGVEFTVQQVPGVDLTTNVGWDLADDLTVAAAQGLVAGVGGTERTTGADGVAAFTGLPLGLYLVTETEYPDGAVPSAPFLVTLPMTHPTELNSWLYDVHVYPKNVVTGATKTIEDDGGVKVGDTVTWTITGDIPNGGRTDAYRVVDPLDAKLDHLGTAVALTDGTAVSEGVHYTLTHDAATNTVTVDFTAAGLDLLAAHTAAQVTVTITTRVNAVGEIANTATVFPNQASIDTGKPVTTPTVETKFGTMTASKVDGDGNALAGAQFRVYPTLADARAGTNAVTIDGTSTWTSDAAGLLTVSGLRYSNFEDGTPLADPATWQHYWLVEVQAPAGYELLAQPIQFDVTSGDTQVDLTVENVRSNGGFTLPLTGASGTALIVVAGTLLLGGAVLLAARTRAQKAAAAA